jgi:antitoxin HigA-1
VRDKFAPLRGQRLRLTAVWCGSGGVGATQWPKGSETPLNVETLAMSAADLARQLKVPTNRITHILNGERAISDDTALRLGHLFGTSAEFWPNPQKLYALRIAESESRADIRQLPRLRDRLRHTANSPSFSGIPTGELTALDEAEKLRPNLKSRDLLTY